jgi:geranylgeranyl reductase family protein
VSAANSNPTSDEPSSTPATIPTNQHDSLTCNSQTCDVLVVGAGPAGAAAAIELARSGRSVIVIDKATFPRDKCCGDGLTTLALRELEHLGFSPSSIDDWFDVDGAVLRSPTGRQVTVPLPTAGRFAAVAPRRQLDHALVQLAARSGATIFPDTAFVSLAHGDDSVVVTANGPEGPRSVRARYVVAADGMWSPVRKCCGSSSARYLGEWHGVRQYVSGVSGPAGEQLFVWFEPDLLPGYAWSFPLPGGRANVGFGVLRTDETRGKQISALWSDLLRRPHIADALGPTAAPQDRHLAWPIPARIDDIELTAERVLFTGDAAAATDVMTGEGIGQALLTGRLAAEAIIGAGATRPELARGLYEREVRHHLLADHRLSKALGSVLATSWGARGAIRVVGVSGAWGRRNFARWMFEDEPRALVATPTRWHRNFLARAGAFVDG